MHKDDDGSTEGTVHAALLPAGRALRLVVDNAPSFPQRRRAPRRQIVAGRAFERRGSDRRQRHPGIDGLLRTVLSDNWP